MRMHASFLSFPLYPSTQCMADRQTRRTCRWQTGSVLLHKARPKSFRSLGGAQRWSVAPPAVASLGEGVVHVLPATETNAWLSVCRACIANALVVAPAVASP